MKRPASGFLLMLLLASILTLALDIQLAKASGTIYIRADGSIDPPTAPISSSDNITYTFTGDTTDFVDVERDDIVIDGSGHTVQGSGTGDGISMHSRSNVTLLNTTITGFYNGIDIEESVRIAVAYNQVYQHQHAGINLEYNVSYSSFEQNSVFACVWFGIRVAQSNNNVLTGNNASLNSKWGISAAFSRNLTVNENKVLCNSWGGIDFANVTDSIIADNNASKNGNGITIVQNSANNVVTSNNASSNSNWGISLQNNYRNNTVAHNSLSSNTADGIYLYNSGYNSVFGNNVTANGRNGIYFQSSSYNNIYENNITDNWNYGVFLELSNYNSVYENNVVNNQAIGVRLEQSSHNAVFGSNIVNNDDGVLVASSSNCTFYENNITGNRRYGVNLAWSSVNEFYHNNFIGNTQHVYMYTQQTNLWDDGYPSGGNYWSDYNGTDYYLGPYQNATGSDLIGDTPNVINSNNRDCFPLMLPWTDWLSRYDCIFRVLGSSMAPTLLQNDLIYIHNTTDPSEIFAAPFPQGDLVVYRKPDNLTVYIVRRAVNKWFEDETWHFTVKSDGTQTEANITMSLIIGKVASLFRSFSVALRERTFTTFIYANSTLDGLALNASGKYLSLNVTGTLEQGSTSHCEIIIPRILLSDIYDVQIEGQPVSFIKNDYGFYTLVTFDTDQAVYTANIYGSAVGTPPDIAVVDVATSRTVVGQGSTTLVDVRVENQGDFTESFNLTISVDTTPLQTVAVTLSYKNSSTFTISMNTVGISKGNHTISATAVPLSEETDTLDNTFTDGWIIVAMIGDITGPDGWPDGKCDIRDIGLVAKYFGQNVPPAPANCDVTGQVTGVPDGKIDIRDVAVVAKEFGKVDP